MLDKVCGVKGQGGGVVVSNRALYSEDPSLIPADRLTFHSLVH